MRIAPEGVANVEFVLAEDPPTVRAPDIAFVSKERLPDPAPGFGRLAPDLAVEVISPSNSAAGIQGKVLDYLDAGTREVVVRLGGARAAEVCASLTHREPAGGGPDVAPVP